MKYLAILFLFATTCLTQTLHLECNYKDLPDAKGNPRTSCSGNLQAQRLTSIDEGSLSFEWNGGILYVRYTGADAQGIPSREQDSFSEVRDEHGNPVPWFSVRTLCIITGPLEGKTGNGAGLFACGQVPPRPKQTGGTHDFHKSPKEETPKPWASPPVARGGLSGSEPETS